MPKSTCTLPDRGTLLFIGDSITDCGRSPSGEETPSDPTTSLGRGYVGMVNALLAATYPDRPWRVLNRGVGGNTVRDLSDRWKADVLELQPQLLVVMIGINDVWRQFDYPQRPKPVSLDEYRSTLTRLLEEARASGVAQTLVLAPYLAEPWREDPMRLKMQAYAAASCDAAEATGAAWVATQPAIDALLAHRHPTLVARDRVHLGAPGHAVLARLVLDALGYAWHP